MTTKSIHEYDDVMQTLGIDVKSLGCVMLPTEPIDIFQSRSSLMSTDDLYYSPDPEKFWVKGDVSEKAHITLLYGLLTPAYEQKGEINRVLDTWDAPDYFIPDNVTFFPSPYPEEPYAAIVVKLDDPALEEAHQRLSYLPHVNTFPTYQPHMTLAYVNIAAAQDWMDVLNESTFHIYVKEGELDYGSEK